jgi:outer membrane murein-binding lipoprotein Lpp
MRGNGCGRLRFRVCAIASSLLLRAVVVSGQDTPRPVTSGSSSTELASDVRALTDSVRELQAQVQALHSQVSELRAEQQVAQAETRELRRELDHSEGQPTPEAGGGNGPDSYAPFSRSRAVSSLSPDFQARAEDAQGPTTEQRIAKLEEGQQLTAANVSEQSQTKVESGSKYRVRFSGIVLLNMFENRGTVDDLDVPQVALPPKSLASAGTFGGALRQSQIGIEVFGPDIAGAHTSANLKFDFAGGFPHTPNGASIGLVRLRTGTIRLDWANTSVIAGQDYLFFAPLAPSSLATLAVPALSYAGNLWGWIPQVRIEHRVALSEDSKLLFQGGILDSLSGDVPRSEYERNPTWGEQSGQPAYAARIAWSRAAFGKELILGVGGYYGRQNFGFGRNLDGWAGTTDLTVPLGRYFDLSAEFYRGRAVGGLHGAIGQSVLLSGYLADSTTIVRGLESMGGWMQLKFKPTANFEVNGAVGQDNPFATELRRFPASPSYYGPFLSKNLSPLVNFIYQARSDVLFSVEYRRLQTFVLDANSQSANHLNLSLGYIF